MNGPSAPHRTTLGLYRSSSDEAFSCPDAGRHGWPTPDREEGAALRDVDADEDLEVVGQKRGR